MNVSWRVLAVPSLASLIMTLSVPAFAQHGLCGDPSEPEQPDVPCRCGDVVGSNTSLNDTDPVTTEVCPCNALFVLDVVLNLGGYTLRGSGPFCPGIVVTGGAVIGNGVTVVGNGWLTGFGSGVAADPDAHNVRLHDLYIVDNFADGIELLGDGSIVENTVVSRNGGDGIVLPGSEHVASTGNIVRGCRVEDNDGNGIRVNFKDVLVEGNYVRRNGGDGIVVTGLGGQAVNLNRAEHNAGYGIVVDSQPAPGDNRPASVVRNWALENPVGFRITGNDVVIDRNRATYNGLGYELGGHSHAVTSNISLDNDSVGFFVEAARSRFETNRSSYDDIGIVDVAGTNTYVGNRCTANPVAKSDPAGLCR